MYRPDPILILELKRKVNIGKVDGGLDYKHIDTNHEDDPNWFDIFKRLNIELSIVI